VNAAMSSLFGKAYGPEHANSAAWLVVAMIGMVVLGGFTYGMRSHAPQAVTSNFSQSGQQSDSSAARASATSRPSTEGRHIQASD